jgi:hypothetical protein
MCQARRPSVLPPDTADDFDALLAHFAAPLPADRRDEFYRDARDALAGLRCIGPGVAHRILAELLREYFIPIPDARILGIKSHHRRSSKLAALPPLA